MRFLLDTHLLLWASDYARKRHRLSKEAADLIADTGNVLYFSAASVWEVAIKHARGHADFTTEPRVFRRGLLENAYREMPITADHAIAVAGLPPIHKDPFDRLLVAQAQVEGLTLLTADAAVARYPAPVRRI